MLAVESLKLIYDGCGKHLIHGLTKATIGEQYGFAERVLDSISYADAPSTLTHLALNGTDATARQAVRNWVQEIHHKHKEEIESKWQQPPMTDDEISDMFYREYLEEELKKIKNTQNYDIRL